MGVGFLAAEAALALGADGARRLGVRARPRVRHQPEPGVAVATRRGDLDRRVGRARRGRRVRRCSSDRRDGSVPSSTDSSGTTRSTSCRSWRSACSTRACGAVFGWLAMLLRRTESEIADRRARDEVAAGPPRHRVADARPRRASGRHDGSRVGRRGPRGRPRAPRLPVRRRRPAGHRPAQSFAPRRRAGQAPGAVDGVADHGERDRRRLPGPASGSRTSWPVPSVRRSPTPSSTPPPNTSSCSPRPTTPASCSSPSAMTAPGSIRRRSPTARGRRVDHRPHGLDRRTRRGAQLARAPAPRSGCGRRRHERRATGGHPRRARRRPRRRALGAARRARRRLRRRR